METIQTPRVLPDDIEDWSKEIEKLLSEWGEVAMCYAYLHNFGQRKYKQKFHHLQIPIIILSTLTGTATFAQDSYVPEGYKQGFSAVVGSFNIFCGILGTLLSFLRYAEQFEGHRIAGLAWSKLSRNIEIELSLQEIKRKPCRDFLKLCRSEYDNLLESSPNIDLDIIKNFNKKFNDDYPDVRKPVICNGLKSIIPYTDGSEAPQRDEVVKKKDKVVAAGAAAQVDEEEESTGPILPPQNP
jgi:hypothetical protein